MFKLALSSSTLCNTSLNTAGSGLLLLLSSESLFLQSMKCALHDCITFESHQRLAGAMCMIKGERIVPNFWSALPGTVIAFGLKWVPWPIIRRSDLAEHRGETLGPWSWWLQKMRNSWTMMAAEDDYWKPMMGPLQNVRRPLTIPWQTLKSTNWRGFGRELFDFYFSSCIGGLTQGSVNV